jgi:hypothetical protein
MGADTVNDWPEIIARLEKRKIDLCAVLRVSRQTLWYWREGHRKPNGDHASKINELDRESVNHC